MTRDYRDTEQYQRFAEGLHERLEATGLVRAARCGGGALREDGALVLRSLGREIIVSPGSFLIENSFNMWYELVLLQYLADGDGCEPMDRWMGLGNFDDGGALRGSSFDMQVRDAAAKELSSFSAAEIARACRALGGEDAESMGDLTYDFLFAPHFPMRVQIWLADDEFSASAKVLVDGNAEHYLGIEAAGSAAVILMNLIAEQACQ
ncbi:MAG: DUF3786 domain-containing protein [Eggerthellales bacterium]|nr:DUF3786 domain-containing protein [Eggerthellales bacterium]